MKECKLIRLRSNNALMIVNNYWVDWSPDWEVLCHGEYDKCMNTACNICSSCMMNYNNGCSLSKNECKGYLGK